MTGPGPEPVPKVRLTGLCCDRGAFSLGPVSIDLSARGITALVGANGAGKTTLLRALTGQLPLRSGRIVLDGNAVRVGDLAWRNRIGYVPDDADELIAECSAMELWRFQAGVRSMARSGKQRRRRAEEYLQLARHYAERFSLDVGDRRAIAEYSLGMRKKTQLVGALAASPDLLILDEPRNGLDPIGIATMHDALEAYRVAGGCVLAASHDLDWALARSQRVVGLSRGALVVSDTTPALRARGSDQLLGALA